MSELAKVKEQFAKELLQHFEVEEESQAHIKPEHTPLACIQALVQNKCYNDAAKMIAHGLPKREAVWWACLATRHSMGTKRVDGLETSEDDFAALAAAENWVKSPNEENRQAAKQLGEKMGFKTAASWVATAAYWCAGSMTPEGEPAVPPPPYLYAHAVAGSISLAAVLPDPEQVNTKFERYIKQGLNLANGGNGEVAD